MSHFPCHIHVIQILRDVPKSRREVDLHWRTCSHPNIVNLIDVYENIFMGHRSLLVVMEWYMYMYMYILKSIYMYLCSTTADICMDGFPYI